jgi:putative FmdB family regulatory protein
MPIYEYRCGNCGHELEALQKISDPALTACPGCHQDALVKLVSAAGFHLKGSGWYATDFRGGGAKPDTAKADAGKADAGKAADAPAKSSEAGTDSKPAATGCGGGCACH